MKLYNEKTGDEIKVGDIVTTFRGESVTVTGWPKDGRNKVWVKNADGDTREYFPSVIDAVLREG